MRMKALSVHQPWGWAIAHGPKRIENRTWFSRYRGPVLIHAARNPNTLKRATVDAWRELLPGLPAVDELVYGAIIAVARLKRIDPVERCRGQLFAQGPFCWQLDDVYPLQPIPYRGAQGLFEIPLDVLPADDVAAIERRLKAYDTFRTRPVFAA